MIEADKERSFINLCRFRTDDDYDRELTCCSCEHSATPERYAGAMKGCGVAYLRVIIIHGNDNLTCMGTGARTGRLAQDRGGPTRAAGGGAPETV